MFMAMLPGEGEYIQGDICLFRSILEIKVNMRAVKNKIRILIADDHQEVRSFFKGILQRESTMEVVGEAANGAEALELLGHCHPDVLLLDLSMPVLDGFAVIEAVKTRENPVRIVVLSSHTLAEFTQTDLVSGPVEAFLNKYEDFDLLVDTIRGIHQKLRAGDRQADRDVQETTSFSVVQQKNRRVLPNY